jgi:hypothetical protein
MVLFLAFDAILAAVPFDSCQPSIAVVGSSTRGGELSSQQSSHVFQRIKLYHQHLDDVVERAREFLRAVFVIFIPSYLSLPYDAQNLEVR